MEEKNEVLREVGASAPINCKKRRNYTHSERHSIGRP